MSTLAHDAVNIPKNSTGPKNEADLESPLGVRAKAKSSRNAIRTGLYAARDFVRPDEEEEYAQTLIKLMDELTPEGTVEQTFATEIMGATWRLRRCRLVEEAFSSIEDLDFDPMVDERTEKQQKSVDRARAQSHLILRRSLAELCKLQSARHLRNPTPEAVRYTREELKAIAKADVDAIMAERKLSSFCKPGETPPPVPQPATSFCEKPKFTPRNAPCPCGSGDKYKRCCGKNARRSSIGPHKPCGRPWRLPILSRTSPPTPELCPLVFGLPTKYDGRDESRKITDLRRHCIAGDDPLRTNGDRY